MTTLRLISLYLCLILLLSPMLPVSASAADSRAEKAIDISGTELVTDYGGISKIHQLFDKFETVFYVRNGYVTLEYEEGIGSLYVMFHQRENPLTLTDNATGISLPVGDDLFLHDYIDLTKLFGTAPTSVTVDFGENTTLLTELCVFTPGVVPDYVQQWNSPAENRTDLLLLSAHGDDDQIFFAGILPYYSAELGCEVQVIFLTDHQNSQPIRIHEMLNGLWAAGVDTYPVFGDFNDFRGPALNLEVAYQTYHNQGRSREELLGFVVQQLRRFKPLVVVTHDFNGEYGHPQHMVCADLMKDAITVSNDASQYPELAQMYGLWDVPKTYIHLYEENPVYIDVDQPLESFDGMSAFHVSKDIAFPCHKSQHKRTAHLIKPYETAAEMRYSPCHYGLYRSTVGKDVACNDFFENLLTYDQQAQKEEEARLAAEESARKAAAERLAAEEAARQAAEEAAREAALQAARVKLVLTIAAIIAIVLLLAIMWIFLRKRHRRNRYS